MPDSPEPSHARRAWRLMAALGCVLGATSILITAVKWTGTDNRQDRQQDIAQHAICSIVVYAEQQADALEGRGAVEASHNLEDLATNMRRTGIHCPPRTHLRRP